MTKAFRELTGTLADEDGERLAAELVPPVGGHGDAHRRHHLAGVVADATGDAVDILARLSLVVGQTGLAYRGQLSLQPGKRGDAVRSHRGERGLARIQRAEG